MPFPAEAPLKIRRKVESGALPVDMPAKTYAGFGTGGPCAGCEEPITKAQAEYELEMADGRKFLMHLGCAGLLEAERRRGDDPAFHPIRVASTTKVQLPPAVAPRHSGRGHGRQRRCTSRRTPADP
jgi:hypothetical protein